MVEGKQQLFTSPSRSPFKYSMFSCLGGAGALEGIISAQA